MDIALPLEGVVVLPVGIFSKNRARFKGVLDKLGAAIEDPRASIGTAAVTGTYFIVNEPFDPSITHIVWEFSYVDQYEDHFCVRSQLLRYMLGIDNTIDLGFLENVQMVTSTWLQTCVAQNGRTPEKEYRVDIVDDPLPESNMTCSSLVGYSNEWISPKICHNRTSENPNLDHLRLDEPHVKAPHHFENPMRVINKFHADWMQKGALAQLSRFRLQLSIEEDEDCLAFIENCRQHIPPDIHAQCVTRQGTRHVPLIKDLMKEDAEVLFREWPMFFQKYNNLICLNRRQEMTINGFYLPHWHSWRRTAAFRFSGATCAELAPLLQKIFELHGSLKAQGKIRTGKVETLDHLHVILYRMNGEGDGKSWTRKLEQSKGFMKIVTGMEHGEGQTFGKIKVTNISLKRESQDTDLCAVLAE